ncbi:MAG: ASPIC/UnbV domain-containing protein [Acidimicrobiia bacterium]|jgi:hypothetical protein
MTDSRGPRRARTITWLVGGAVVGVVLTGATVLVAAAWLDDGTSGQVASPPVFEEVTGSAGVDQVYDGEFQFFVGGGVAVFDCNDDRLPDLFLAGGTNESGLYVNESDVGGQIGFTRITGPETDLPDVTGAYPIDIDSDGYTDLAVLRVGENLMLRGRGGCSFERANELWGIDGGEHWTAAFSARWEEDAALPSIAFGNYLRLKESGERDECEDHFLFRPDGDRYGEPETMTPGYCALSILFSDWNRSGQTDLRMTNDRHYYTDGQEQLWNMGDAKPAQYSNDEGWQNLKIWGMGIASQDLDQDGLPEVFLTSQGDNKLQSLIEEDRPTYEDIALASRATVHRPFAGDTLRPSTAWHAEFDDVNNDSFMDLFITKGNVDAQIDFAREDPNNLLIGRPEGIFVETADVAGLLDYERSRGGGVVDLNLDGLLDVIVVERRVPVRVWQNTGEPATGGISPGNWLQIDLQQSGPNRDAIGAWIEVEVANRTITREVTIGGGHASGELGWIHFGLGAADEARVRVVWPGGEASEWQRLDANQRVIWDRGSGPGTWAPARD